MRLNSDWDSSSLPELHTELAEHLRELENTVSCPSWFSQLLVNKPHSLVTCQSASTPRGLNWGPQEVSTDRTHPQSQTKSSYNMTSYGLIQTKVDSDPFFYENMWEDTLYGQRYLAKPVIYWIQLSQTGPLSTLKGNLIGSAQDILNNAMLQTSWQQFGEGPFLIQHDCTKTVYNWL